MRDLYNYSRTCARPHCDIIPPHATYEGTILAREYSETYSQVMSNKTTKIIVTEEDGAVVGEFILQQGEHLIGRTADCSIKLKSDHVSREHARLNIGGDTLEIEDLDSSWGTFLDNVQITGRTTIKPTQKLRISDLNFDIEIQSLAKMGPTKVEELPKSVLIPSGGVAEDSQIKEEAAEAAEVDLVAVEPDKELEPGDLSKIAGASLTERPTTIVKPAIKETSKAEKAKKTLAVKLAVVVFIVAAIGIGGWMLFPSKKDYVDFENLMEENGITYEKGESTPYTGTGKSFFPDGKTMKEVQFKDGKENGQMITWYENGQMSFKANFIAGEYGGEVATWSTNGVQQSISVFQNGNEVSRKSWDENGTEIK